MKSSSRINKQEQVQVVIRLKPQNPQNKYQRCAYLATQDSNALVVQTSNKKEYFVFDAIANEDTSQFQLYQNIGREAVTQSLQGYNCCIFAYGQTGSGKTYSILGILSDIFQNIYSQTRGILPRLLQDLFKQVQSASDKFIIRCSYMQIYNQQIFDLLNQSTPGKFLQIRQAPQKGVYIQGLDLEKTHTYQDAVNLLLQGQKNRKIAQTDMNKESSRSHTIFTVNIQTQTTQQDVIKVRRSKINIVDLAGSQRVKHTNVEGQRLREGCNINKSLHVLGNVINALVESTKKKKHIPFRDSKLTYYLKDSLGGNSITKLLANIQCNSKYLGDTLSTLMFAKRAKILKMKVQVNQNATQNYDNLRKQIKKLREQLAQAKYINETRLSQRFQTQNETQFNFQKYDTSNFDYSNNDKPIQIFEENELQYKALIQIYEEHMKDCNALTNCENTGNVNANCFTKKKTANILTHSEWKKLQKKNTTLMNLVKRIPAFTKIYRQNQLLKQERNQQKKLLKGWKKQNVSLSQTEQKLPQHSTTLYLEQSSNFDISQQSNIPTHTQIQLFNSKVQRTIEQYECIIGEMKHKFNQCLESLDNSYSALQKQIQQKDKKIKEISKRQYQLPSNIEDLIDQNQYLKLNILQLQSDIDSLYKELEQNRIKQKEEGRRYSLFQEPTSNKKIQSSNWLIQSANIPQEEDKKHQNHQLKDVKAIDANPELQLNQEVVKALQNFKAQALKQVQMYNQQRQQMVQCVQKLQKQCKRLISQNKSYILKNQELKNQKNKLIQEFKHKNPQFNIQKLLANYHHQKLKPLEDLWNQFLKQKKVLEDFQSYKNQTHLQKESLYEKLNQMEKIKQQLNQFIMKQKATEKQFGKSINQILDQYAQILQSKSQSIVVNSRQSGSSSSKMLISSKSSKLLGQYSSGASVKISKQYLDRQRVSNIEISSQKREVPRNSSKAASQQKNFFVYRSPKK